MAVRDFKNTTLNKKVFDLLMNIFQGSKQFLLAEKYSVTDQIRRLLKNVYANLAEAYPKKDIQLILFQN